MRPAIAAVVLAVVGGVVGSIVLSGGGPSIVDRAEAALAAPVGKALHIRMLGSTTTADGRVVRWEDEEWLISGTISPRRAIETATDGRRFETGMTEDGLAELYDPASNTIYATYALGSASEKLSPEDAAMLERRALSPQERVKLLLAGGELEDRGHVTVDGRDAIRLVTASGDVTYLVDPDTYVPIELRATSDGRETDLRFPVYEALSATAVQDGALSLEAQHPDAAVKVDKLAYEEHWAALAPAKP